MSLTSSKVTFNFTLQSVDNMLIFKMVMLLWIWLYIFISLHDIIPSLIRGYYNSSMVASGTCTSAKALNLLLDSFLMQQDELANAFGQELMYPRWTRLRLLLREMNDVVVLIPDLVIWQQLHSIGGSRRISPSTLHDEPSWIQPWLTPALDLRSQPPADVVYFDGT